MILLVICLESNEEDWIQLSGMRMLTKYMLIFLSILMIIFMIIVNYF